MNSSRKGHKSSPRTLGAGTAGIISRRSKILFQTEQGKARLPFPDKMVTVAGRCPEFPLNLA